MATSRSDRRLRVAKQRPEDWPEEAPVGRFETQWGICDLEMNGRELRTKWIVNGPKPRAVASKRKHRRPV